MSNVEILIENMNLVKVNVQRILMLARMSDVDGFPMPAHLDIF